MGVMGPEDLDRREKETIEKVFEGKVRIEDGIKVSDYVDTDFSLLINKSDRTQEKRIIKLGEKIKCPICDANVELIGFIKNLPTQEALQFWDLVANIKYNIDRQKIVQQINEGKMDKYEALKSLKKLRIKIEQRKEHLREDISIHMPILCAKCKQQVGILDGRFFPNENVPKYKEVTSEEIEKLPNPKKEVLARICNELGIDIQNFEVWIQCKWVNELTKKIERWKAEIPKDTLCDVGYQIGAFLSEILDYAEKEQKHRKFRFSDTLNTLVDEDLARGE